MSQIAENIEQIHHRMARACVDHARDPSAVRLLAVSKTFSADDIRDAHAAGQREFGENYVQEAIAKQAQLGPLAKELVWHHIGPIQSNKTREIAAHFAWAHGVDRLKIAQRLSEQRPAGLPDLNVCVQVNISGEDSKSGCAPEQVPSLCAAIVQLPRLRLRGLMAIPAPATDSDPRLPFRALQALWLPLHRQHPEVDTLSAGMSADLEAAIAEGSTLVRVGTAIFGSRTRMPAGVP